MATLSDPFNLCPIFSDKNKVYVTPSEERGSVTVTHKSRCVDVFKVEDQKTIHSWSMRHGLAITGPVVFSDKESKYIAVQDKTELRLWSCDQNNVEKAKKCSMPSPVHQVLVLPDHDPVILFENGCVEYLSHITAEGGHLKDEEIIWSDIVQCSGSVGSVFVLSRSKDGRLITYIYKHRSESGWMPVTSVVLPVSDQRVSCCCLASKQKVDFYCLAGNGDLYCVSEHGGSAVKVLTLPVRESSNMVTVGECHVAVSGVKKNGRVGLGIFDVMFGSLLAWKAYPEGNSNMAQLFAVEKHLYVVTGQAVYGYEYSCEPCSLASALGSFGDRQLTKGDHLQTVPLAWKVSSAQVTEVSGAEVLDMFDKLNNPSKTSTEKTFRETFQSLILALQNPDYQQFWTSPYMTQFIRRLTVEKNFWPREEILQVVKQGFVPPSVMAEFFEALIRHTDLLLLHASVSHLHDVPESQLIQTLNYYLSCEDQDFAELCDETVQTLCTDNPEEGARSPFGLQKRLFINTVLSQPYNDIFLLECLQNVKFEYVLLLLQYLYYILKTHSSVDNIKENTPSMVQVVDWMALLVDGHATQLILSPDARPVLVDLHELVQQQLEFYDELISLEAVLSQLKKKCAPVKQKSVGLYCIEVLHVS